MKHEVGRPLRCGIVLAGGEGKRLQPFIRRTLGFDLPKQYVSFIGTRSMLEHTYSRMERLIPAERIFTVAAREHFRFPEVQQQLEKRPPETIIVQPMNKETGPGLLLPLIHLWKRYPSSIIAVFPSDHFIMQQGLFKAHVRRAFQEVEKCPEKIIFMGVKPTDSDPEYGYILPQIKDANSSLRIQRIGLFIEKPERAVAEELILQGALWNTMVMVFKPEILWHLVGLTAPKLYQSFQKIFRALGTRHEQRTIEDAYGQMEKINFSKDLLEGFGSHSRSLLSVADMDGVFWSDWGAEDRIVSVLEQLDSLNKFNGNLMFDNTGEDFKTPGIISKSQENIAFLGA